MKEKWRTILEAATNQSAKDLWNTDIKKTTKEEIAAKGYALNHGRFVGAEDVVDDGEPFEDKMKNYVGEYAKLSE